MGTRADFYIGRGQQAEWLGSIAWDGYPDGLRDTAILTSKTEEGFREAVAEELARRDDGTTPVDGWPWPWANSLTTDYSYAFDGDVYACCFGHRWYRANDPALNDDETEDKEAVFPDMTARQRVTMGKRSGVIVIQS